MVLFLLLIVILPSNVKALSVDKNNLTIKSSSNETIALYAEVEKEIKEVSFSLVYTSYDVPAYFNVEAGLSDQSSGIKHKITFSEPVTGKVRLGTVRINVVNNPKVTVGSVNVHSATALTTTHQQCTRVPISQISCQNLLFSGLKHFCYNSHSNRCEGFPGGSAVKNPPVILERQVQSLSQEDPLEKEMAAHSTILAWRSSWPEEPGGLQFRVAESDRI